eukprot:TRINITY_DN7145_c0_g1_i1.p2 TRINITY_DN7145_c0_g1~~TRINITY_DN7145_c0_g1_i1.p2  ORF type:complete len:93 (+),score=13.29 TRINITY_DN7145_c0_g1_i1:272-550(+)
MGADAQMEIAQIQERNKRVMVLKRRMKTRLHQDESQELISNKTAHTCSYVAFNFNSDGKVRKVNDYHISLFIKFYVLVIDGRSSETAKAHRG